jgi:CTP synthase (UTP-ammonia lyase)
MNRSIAILGEYSPTSQAHLATTAAIEHSCALLETDIEGVWVPTESIGPWLWDRFTGIWVAPGAPYKDMDRALWAIRCAREHLIPCFGTCGGFQHMVLEYARNVLGFKDAQHAEYDPYASHLFIARLECSLVGREMPLRFTNGSQVARVYGALSATEHYYCNFGVAPEYIALLKSGAMQVTGSDSEGEVRVIELPGHPFFIGTLFVPQTRSTPQRSHPLVTAFLQAVLEGRPRRA